jgi:hypothetical protein
MAKVKYMGVADVRTIPKGTDFDGRLANPTTKDLVFNRANRWIIDTDESDLSAEAVELLLAEEGFKDVSDLKVIPSNEHQTTFLGHKKTDTAATEAVAAAASEDDDDQNPSGAGDAAAPVTTVGGSTAGRGGGRRGAAGT